MNPMVYGRKTYKGKCCDFYLRSGYFDYLLDTHLDSKDEGRAAMSLRIAYHHSMETLFSLRGALLQAPSAPHAWLSRCSNSKLKKIVSRITANDGTLPKRLSLHSVSWHGTSQIGPGTDRQVDSIQLFADFWRLLSGEFLNQNRIDEYNSLKHGFRVSSGGFGLRFGVEHEYGSPPPDDEMHTIPKSQFGTSFRRFVPASNRTNNRLLLPKRVSINWKIEKIVPLIQLISISIENTIGVLRILNGERATSIRFSRPEKDEAFTEPWTQVPPINDFVSRLQPGFELPFLSKEDLMNEIDAGN